jgi:acyl-CoA thioester hydrolase
MGPMTGSDPWPDLAGRLTEAGHVLPVRVYFEDTDFSGWVYHASYLRLRERTANGWPSSSAT